MPLSKSQSLQLRKAKQTNPNEEDNQGRPDPEGLPAMQTPVRVTPVTEMTRPRLPATRLARYPEYACHVHGSELACRVHIAVKGIF